VVPGFHVSYQQIYSFAERNDVSLFPGISNGYCIETDWIETDVSVVLENLTNFSCQLAFTNALVFLYHYFSLFFSLRMLKIYHRFKMAAKTGEFFALHQWNFTSDNLQYLQQAMDNSADQELFNVDISMLNWDAYIKNYISGIRKYVLKDPVETIPSARKKLHRFDFFLFFLSFFDTDYVQPSNGGMVRTLC